MRRSGSAACIKGVRGCEVQCYRWRQGGSVTCIEGVVVGCGVALRGRGKHAGVFVGNIVGDGISGMD